MKAIFLLMYLLMYSPIAWHLPTTSSKPDYADEEDDDEHFQEETEQAVYNSTEPGVHLGAPCEFTCSQNLYHVYCNPTSGRCECEKKYPVKLNPFTGCGEPKRLGEQCYYRESCTYSDQHSSCIQIHHNAICQCKTGYHSVSIKKPSKRTFCAEDVKLLATDYSTLAGVLSGIAVLSGLICFVLKLFNQNKYHTRPHRFGNANLAPPIFFSNETGIGYALPIIERSSTSRASSERTLNSFSSRRDSSTQGYRGFSLSGSHAGVRYVLPIMIESSFTSRASSQQTLASVSSRPRSSIYGNNRGYSPSSHNSAGSRRPSLTSVHSGSSIRSYSQRRLEREREQKEERELQKRFARITSNGKAPAPPTPSPRSTDELLPPLAEDKPVPLAIQEEEDGHADFDEENKPSTSKQY